MKPGSQAARAEHTEYGARDGNQVPGSSDGPRPVWFVSRGIFHAGCNRPCVGEGDMQAGSRCCGATGRTAAVGCRFHWPGRPIAPGGWSDAGRPGAQLSGNGLTIRASDGANMARGHGRVGPQARSVIVTAARPEGAPKLENRGRAEIVAGQNITE